MLDSSAAIDSPSVAVRGSIRLEVISSNVNLLFPQVSQVSRSGENFCLGNNFFQNKLCWLWKCAFVGFVTCNLPASFCQVMSAISSSFSQSSVFCSCDKSLRWTPWGSNRVAISYITHGRGSPTDFTDFLNFLLQIQVKKLALGFGGCQGNKPEMKSSLRSVRI